VVGGPVRIEVPARDLTEALEVVGSAAHRGVGRAMGVMAREHNAKLKVDAFRGDRLRRRTGLLRNSMQVAVSNDGAKHPEASSYIAGPSYARIQEHGGEIRPTKGTYLTIPLDAAKTARGVTRAQAKMVKRAGGWETAQRVPGAADRGTWIRRKSPTSNPIIYVMGRDGKPLPLYVLVRSVKIPGKLGFYKTWDDLAPRREKMWKRTLDLLGQHFQSGRGEA
jgi:hypothetical protein